VATIITIVPGKNWQNWQISCSLYIC